MSVKELKQELTSLGVDFSDCIEKSELVSRLASARLDCPLPLAVTHESSNVCNFFILFNLSLVLILLLFYYCL